MRLIYDIDTFIYAAAFSSETKLRKLRRRGETAFEGVFTSAKDRDVWLKALGYGNKRKDWLMDFEEVTEVQARPPEDAIKTFDHFVWNVWDFFEPDEAVAYINSDINFRKMKHSFYKSHRDYDKPINFNSVRSHAQEMAESKDGLEADDLVIIDATRSKDDWVIVGEDKDLKQIPGTFYNWRKNILEVVTPMEAIKNFWTQVLTGDTADNIPGLPRVGPKTAEKILSECRTQVEFRKACVDAYEGHCLSEEIMDRNASLLYLLRAEDDEWTGMLPQ